MDVDGGMPDQPSVAVAPANAPEPAVGGTSSQQALFGKWLLAGIVAILLVALFWIGPRVWQLAQDEKLLSAWVTGLGWWGPLALVALNAIQIVVAPIPGYVAQVAAGFLFGPFWGGVWSSVGLVIGATIAFWLARFYGRPWVGRLVGHERLAQWERVSHSSSFLVWLVLLLGPIGDIPYFLAGLSPVPFAKILIITLAVRVPSTFVVAAAGAGVLMLMWWQVAILMVVLLGLLFLFFRHQEQIVRWGDHHLRRRVERMK
jgi:uncharacterized membrane protein YdjX (TVP38/TMEM64 family)